MASDIWSVADKLRGPYMRHEYGEVILPLTVLRRLDAVMAKTRLAVRNRYAELTRQGVKNKDRPLQLAAKLPFYNTSDQDFSTITADSALLSVRKNLQDYLAGFSENIQKIVERFDLYNQISRMFEARILYQVVSEFAGMKDLEKLSTHDMGYVFEHLIRKFYEDANATAGEHFTPREVIHLMVNLLIAPDRDTISGEGQVINILDPACGTTGMLTAAEDKIKSFNLNARVYLWGQEFNPLAWATGSSEMLLRAQPGSIFFGNSGYRRRKDRARLRGEVRGRAAADQRRVVPVPPAHDLQDGAGRGQGVPTRDRLQRVTAVHRRGGLR
jgi:type I restriction enzyme M protein